MHKFVSAAIGRILGVKLVGCDEPVTRRARVPATAPFRAAQSPRLLIAARDRSFHHPASPSYPVRFRPSRQPDLGALASWIVAGKTENQQARETVAAYHEDCLRRLVDHVADTLDRYRAGQLDAFAVDETIHRYHRAARELWKFCWAGGGSHLRMTARLIDEQTADRQVTDWWERSAPSLTAASASDNRRARRP